MTGAPAFVIGVDLGTGGPKVALATDRGELAGLESASVPTRILSGGGAEQDPDDWWQAIADCVRKLLAGHPGSAERVSAICFSSQWGGTVPVDAHGRATHPALIWMDGRGAPYAQQVTGGWPALPGSGYGPRKLRAWVAKTGGAPSRTGICLDEGATGDTKANIHFDRGIGFDHGEQAMLPIVEDPIVADDDPSAPTSSRSMFFIRRSTM